MEFSVKDLPTEDFPALLHEIPQPPTSLNYRGELPSPDLKLLAVVGSRKYSNYGKEVVEYLIDGLRGYPIGIVSGLALGIDSLAHEAALRNQLYTLAIPGGGLSDEAIYPARHKPLARRILESGGGLLSEYEPDFQATTWSFPKRNRLVCGIASATLLIEAAPQSGTLITARMASDYNRDLLVVPGSIFSTGSKGTHQFLKLGAIPVTEPNDVLEVLHIDLQDNNLSATNTTQLSDVAERILTALHEPLSRDELIRATKLPPNELNTVLMELELAGRIVESGGRYRIH